MNPTLTLIHHACLACLLAYCVAYRVARRLVRRLAPCLASCLLAGAAASAAAAPDPTPAVQASVNEPSANGVMQFPHVRVERQLVDDAARRRPGQGMTAYRDPVTRKLTGPGAAQAAALLPPNPAPGATPSRPVLARPPYGGVSTMVPERFDRYASVCRNAAGQLMERCDHEK